jgi:hypothetical protein
MAVLLYLHITLMILGFLMLGAYSTVCHAATRLADGAAIIPIFRSVAGLAPAGRVCVIAGLLTGLILARPYGYAAAWLLASYALMIASIGVGAALLEPFQKRLLSAAADPDPAPLQRLRHSKIPLYASLTNGLVLALFCWLMFAKP